MRRGNMYTERIYRGFRYVLKVGVQVAPNAGQLEHLIMLFFFG